MCVAKNNRMKITKTRYKIIFKMMDDVYDENK